MYQVDVKVSLAGSNGMLALSRLLRLPFAPFPGLELRGITSEPEFSEVVLSVAWDVNDSRFHVELADCDCPEETLAELLDHYGTGWELHEPGFECGYEQAQDP